MTNHNPKFDAKDLIVAEAMRRHSNMPYNFRIGDLEVAWQSTPQMWQVYTDPEGYYGLGHTVLEAIIAYYEEALEEEESDWLAERRRRITAEENVVRLQQRVTQLEQQVLEYSWKMNPDRMGS